TVGSRRPGRRAIVGHLVNDDILGWRGPGLDQFQRLAVVLQLAVENAGEWNRAAVSRRKTLRIARNHQESIRLNNAAAGEAEVRAIEPETGKIKRVDRGGVVKLDKRRARRRG